MIRATDRAKPNEPKTSSLQVPLDLRSWFLPGPVLLASNLNFMLDVIGNEGQWSEVLQLMPLEPTDRIWEEEGPVTPIRTYIGR